MEKEQEKEVSYGERDSKQEGNAADSLEGEHGTTPLGKQPMAMGVETDRYDLLPEVDRDPKTEAELEGKDGVQVNYSFNGKDIREGLQIFQRATIYKRNLIFTLLLAVMFVVYSVNITQDPGNMLSTILAVVCVAVMVLIWYLPRKHIKATAETADTNDLQFCMTVYDNCVQISEEANGSFVIHYGKEVSRSFETENLFMVCVGKERIFMLPKRYLEGEQIERVRTFLQQGMTEKHFDKRV